MKVLRPEVSACLKSNRAGMHGVTDLLDDLIVSQFNITDDEFDFICEHATDEELDSFVLTEDASFADRRKAIEIRNKYVNLFNSQEA